MAIFSLHHTAIGKTTQAQPHTASAHVHYITRRQALRRLEVARFPDTPGAIARHLRALEDSDRVNARVADKVMLALPRELSPQQRVELVCGFAEEFTQGRAPWLAAFHDKGQDRDNPHCHLLIRDRDPQTGKRVIGMSDAGSTERLREAWERHANAALEAAGRSERVDRRTLAAQGVKRLPTIHEGPRAQEMDARGVAPRSKAINTRNGRGARQRSRQVDYRRIDRGQSRPEYNRAIRAETEAEYWAAIDADAQRREFVALGLGADAARHALREARMSVGTGRSGSSARPGRKGNQRWRERQDMRGERVVPGRPMPDEVRRLHYETRLRQAEHALESVEGRLSHAWERAYRSPDTAKQRLARLWHRKGIEAVEEKLSKRPGYFGLRPGSILSSEGYRPGAAGKQEEATAARRALPHLFREACRASQEVMVVRRAMEKLQRKRPDPAGAGRGQVNNAAVENRSVARSQQVAQRNANESPSAAGRRESAGEGQRLPRPQPPDGVRREPERRPAPLQSAEPAHEAPSRQTDLHGSPRAHEAREHVRQPDSQRRPVGSHAAPERDTESKGSRLSFSERLARKEPRLETPVPSRNEARAEDRARKAVEPAPQQNAAKPSFSQRLAQQRNDVATREQDNQRTRDRLRKEQQRGLGIDRDE